MSNTGGDATVHRFPCDSCGADMRFAPEAAAMQCDHCGNQAEIEGVAAQTRPVVELDLVDALNTLPKEEFQLSESVHCDNCGANFFLETNVEHSGTCPFCASPVVVDPQKMRQIRPTGVLPFALSETAARTQMGAWLGSLWFAPSGLQKFARRGRKLNGVYIPYWTYDARSDSRYSGERGDIYTTYETRLIDGQPKQVAVQRIRWHHASGRVPYFHDDVLISASKTLPKDVEHGLSTWDLSRLEPYHPELLAGFRSEAYQIDHKDGFEHARAIIDRTILREIKYDIGGDRQRVHSVKTNLSDLTFKHVLLPMWIASYRYRGKTYRITINGQSGQIHGQRPYSAIKIFFAATCTLLIAAGIAYIAANSQ
ncbi:MAG: primosomal protein N' (replication factor Y) - superfamily II helicase [Halocynthiibacter sp.]